MMNAFLKGLVTVTSSG